MYRKYNRPKYIRTVITSLPKVAVVFFLELFTAVIYACIYIHLFNFCRYVNNYSNWLREQFCKLSLNMLYILSVQQMF